MKSFKYECSKCGNTITVFVEPAMDPTCSKHTGGGHKMTLKSTTKPQYMKEGASKK